MVCSFHYINSNEIQSIQLSLRNTRFIIFSHVKMRRYLLFARKRFTLSCDKLGSVLSLINSHFGFGMLSEL